MNSRRSILPYLLLLVLFLPLGVVLLGLDLSPAVSPALPAGVEDADRTRRLAKRAWRALRKGGASITLTFSEQELNSIAAFVDRGTGRLTARADVDAGHADGIVSLRLLQKPVATYLNLRFRVKSSRDGIEITRFRLGSIPLPGPLVLDLTRMAIDVALGDGAGSDVLQCIRSVEFGGNVVTVTVCPLLQTSGGGVGLRRRLERLRDQTEPFGDTALVALYIRRLAELDAQLPATGSVSLARFVGPLFAMARDRGGIAAEENRAAILALASIFGSRKFEQLIGSFFYRHFLTCITQGSGFSSSISSDSPNPEASRKSAMPCAGLMITTASGFNCVSISSATRLTSSCVVPGLKNAVTALHSSWRKFIPSRFVSVMYKPSGRNMAIPSTSTVIRVPILCLYKTPRLEKKL